MDHFGISGPIERGRQAFQQCDRLFNGINEATGQNLTRYEMLYILLSHLGIDVETVPISVLDSFFDECDSLFFEHRPQLTDPGISSTVHAMREAGITLSILSNTGFILGESLRKMLPLLGLKDCFDFQLYSDELGASKPSLHAFTEVYRLATEIRPLEKLEILHLGDNRKADYDGARSAGMSALLLDPVNDRLSDLLIPLTCIPALQGTK
jgi:putative hydrolase of the HAD superfamily